MGGIYDSRSNVAAAGIKRATTSLMFWYQELWEPMPVEGSYNIILNTRDEAVCIIRTCRVFVSPFCKVSAEYADREGEGDKSLDYWRQVHRKAFSLGLAPYGKVFTEDMEVVCEEF